MLVFADVHLNEDSAEVVLGRVLPGIAQRAMDMGVRDLAMLGDLWHVRYRVDVRIQNALRDELLRWGQMGLRLRVLPGNHDQVDVNGRNALEVFDDLQNVSVYTEPTVDELGFWMPYRKRIQDVVVAIDQLQKGAGTNAEGLRVLWGHAPIRGALMNDHKADTDGFPLDLFESFDRVVLGHYHKRQWWTHGNTCAWYVGSVREVSANEAGQDKGFGWWDGRQLTYETQHWGPRFHKFEIGKGQKLDLSAVRPGDDVRVETGAGVSVEKIGAQLATLGVRHTVTPKVEAPQLRLEVVQNATIDQYAEAYAQKLVPDGLDLGRLLATYRELAGGAA